MEDLKEFLLLNGFKQDGDNFVNNKCSIGLGKEGCTISIADGVYLVKRPASALWVVGALSYYELIPPNYKRVMVLKRLNS